MLVRWHRTKNVTGKFSLTVFESVNVCKGKEIHVVEKKKNEDSTNRTDSWKVNERTNENRPTSCPLKRWQATDWLESLWSKQGNRRRPRPAPALSSIEAIADTLSLLKGRERERQVCEKKREKCTLQTAVSSSLDGHHQHTAEVMDSEARRAVPK